MLSQRRDPNNVLANDDQNIISEIDGRTTILVPSNGYTFGRTPTQVICLSSGPAAHDPNKGVAGRITLHPAPDWKSGTERLQLVPGCTPAGRVPGPSLDRFTLTLVNLTPSQHENHNVGSKMATEHLRLD